MFKKIDHVGIAVKDLKKALEIFSGALGLTATHEETVNEYGIRLVNLTIGDVDVELLEGTSRTSPIAKFVEQRGEGIQHICFEVEDIRSAIKELKEKGLVLIDQEPRRIRPGRTVAFLHPHRTHGVLIELVEKEDSPRDKD